MDEGRLGEPLRAGATAALSTIAHAALRHGVGVDARALEAIREHATTLVLALVFARKAESMGVIAGATSPIERLRAARARLGSSLFSEASIAALGLAARDVAAASAALDALPFEEVSVRALGDAYEALLELRLARDGGGVVVRGHDGARKSAGSYYTREAIVDHLVRRALAPLLADAGDDVERVLSIAIVDPAMGTGHFLRKAIDVVAEHLAALRRERTLAEWRRLARARCVYGVDVSPTAVELARLSLALHVGGDDLVDGRDRLRCGDALLGAPFVRVPASAPRAPAPRVRAFDWPIEFPDVAGRGGFDVVVGNPPWERLKPTRRDFFGRFSDEIAGAQGASLGRLVARLVREDASLGEGWTAYEARVAALARALRDGGEYAHQWIEIDGRRTGGDADLFRYFVERAVRLARPGGRVGQVVPATLWQAEGCTALRRWLASACTLERVLTFENARRWAFDIHGSFKFSVFVLTATPAPPTHEFPAALGLRGPEALDAGADARAREVALSRAFLERVSPATLAFVDVRGAREARLVRRLHEELPALGDPASGWDVRYAREVDLTHDAARFRTRAWLRARGFAQVLPRRGDGRDDREDARGGEHWIAPSAARCRARGLVEREELVRGAKERYFVHPADVGAREHEARIFPGERYVALYEGRMVHGLDHAQKGYVAGEGRRARWRALGLDDKHLAPRVFVCAREVGFAPRPRLGFCDVTGASNERTMIAALLPPACPAGNTVPILETADARALAPLVAILSSFVADWLLRLRVTTHLNWTYVRALRVPPRARVEGAIGRRLSTLVARLSCTTPELAGAWEAAFPGARWSRDAAERDPRARAELRAEIDALVAGLYGLSIADYARVLASFPLLDRAQPALDGDAFVEEGARAARPRSFVTRDLALLRACELRGKAPPRDLDAFYRDEVGLDPRGPLATFRIGKVRDLEARVRAARELGAVAYVPTA